MIRQRKSVASLLQSALGVRRPRTLRKRHQPKGQLQLEHLESREVPAMFTVSSTLDDGSVGTLRWAITQANAASGYDTIDFGFTTAGVHTIQPLTPLPWITDAVKIDGYSQAGASPNTLAVGSDAVLNIELDGSLSGGSGLVLWGDGNTVQGLVINNFPGYGVFLYYSDSNVIAGNFIGTDPSGTLSRPNDWGVKVLAARNNIIGGANPADRNVVSGNKYDGINLQGTYNPTDFQCVGNQVVNNYAGTNAAGAAALPNGSATSDGYGISVGGGSGNLVAGNLVSGNDDGGMILGDFDSTVQGNRIGTDATGTYGIPNTGYLYISVYGNGIYAYGDNNLIGGDQPGEGNIIAFNDGAGIYVTIHNASYSLTSVAIRGNSIHSNGGLGIDLGPEGTNTRGPNGNDSGDTDAGPNGYQNFPLVAAASSSGGGTVVTGTLNSTGSTGFTLDFYASPAADPSGYGEGKLYLGSAPVTTDVNGDVTFNATVSGIAPVGWFLSATATGPSGTSEFSGLTTVDAGNTAPSDLALNGGSILENDLFTLTGAFSDPDTSDTHSVTVDWGDGTSPEAFTLPAGARSFAFDHRYLDDNPTATGADDDHPTVTVSDGALSVQANTTVRVTNVAPSNLRWSLTDVDIAENGTSTINVTFDDPGTRDSHRVTVDWGDGAVETYTVAYTERGFSHTHTYRDDNPTATPQDSYVVRASVLDDDGGAGRPATSAIYGLKSENAGTVPRTRPPVHLFTFQSDGTAFVDVGIVRLNGTAIDVDGLAFSASRGLLAYQMIHASSGVAPASSQLIVLDPATAAATPVGSALAGRAVRAAAFDALDRLWVVDHIQDQLLQIDPLTGSTIGSPVNLALGGNPFNLGDLTDLAVRDDGAFILSDGAGASFYSLDPATGVLTLLAHDTAPQPGQSTTAPAGIGMAFSGDSLLTYDAQGTEDIYRYDTANGFARSTVFLNIIPGYNAGQGDLATAATGVKITVHNLDPVLDTFNATSDYGTGVVHVSGAYHDVGSLDTHTLVINWGDGSEEPVSLGSSGFTATHTYTDPGFDPLGKYAITATLQDDDSGIASKVATFSGAIIAGVKFRDVNKDGAKAVTDNPMNGWIIYLDDDNDGVRDSGERYAVTTGLGDYAFSGLDAGTYAVREEGAFGWTQTTAPWNITIGSGQVFDRADIGNYREAIINGVKFDDFNGDGVRQSGEIGLEGWAIFLDDNDNGILDSGEASTVTDAGGGYAFDPVPAGIYRVREVQQSGWTQTSGNATFTVAPDVSNQVFTSEFGNFKLGTIAGGQLFEDENGNGTRDSGEPGLGGRIVFLDGDNDGVLDPGEASRTTDPDGGYSFGELPIGAYHVRTQLSSGWSLTTAPVDVSVTGSGQTLSGGVIGMQLQPTSLSGFVWLDADDDGLIDATEQGVGGVRIELSGVNDRGETVGRVATTDADGHYMFDALRPGTYQVREVQPSNLIDGRDAVGSLGGTLANDLISGIYVDAGQNGIQYDFGERAPSGSYVHKGQTATIGFWQNKNGQALIKSLNGGAQSTALGNWLASNFGNLYGAGAGANNLTGKTNAQVAAYYLTLFGVKGQKLEAQVFATALAVYVTNSGLAGTTATAYGFEVSATGTGSATFNVGSNGSAFGVANNTKMTVLDILRATNARSSGGVLYGGSTTLRNMANTVYDGINNQGDIG